MGSVKLKDLKAFVRYDGSGRVVSGSLVFRKKKPKNGRWGEITKNLCCTDSGSSTTTSTTSSGSTVNAFTKGFYFSGYTACTSTVDGSLTFYSTSSILEAGTHIYADPGLTVNVATGYVILAGPGNMTKYYVQDGVLQNFECPTFASYGASTNSSEACSGGINLYAGGVDQLFYTIYANFVGNGFYIGTTVYIRVIEGMQYVVKPYLVTGDYTANSNGSSIPCPSATTTTTTTAFVGTYYVAGPNAEVCGGTGPYSLPLIVDPNACSNGGITLAVGTYADYGITNGSVIYINLQNGNVIQVQTFGSSIMSFGCQSCG